MSRPPAQAGAGTPGAGGRPPQQAGATIQTILQNLPNLFQMHARGTLSDLQINQLRQLMHTHYRQIIASSIATSRPNPLLSLPPAIDPTLPWQGRPPLVSKEAYKELIAKTTMHIREAMAKRASELQRSQLGQVQAGSVSTPSPPAAGGVGGASQAHGQAVRPNIMTNPSTSATAGAPTRPPAQMVRPGTPGGNGTRPQPRPRLPGPPPGVLTHEQLRSLARLPQTERQEWLSRDPARLAQFNMSVKYWQAQSKPPDPPAQVRPPPPNQQPVLQPVAQQPTATSSAGPSTPPAAAAVASAAPDIASTSTSAPQPETPSTVPTLPTLPTDPATGPTASEPDAPEPNVVASTAGPSSTIDATPNTSDDVQPPAVTDPSTTTSTDPPGDVAPAPADDTAVFLASAAANPSVNPAFVTALPDARTFELKPPPPPPPPPEPEDVRRRRKWKEFVEELAPGLEVEQGVDEVLGDLLDSMIEEGVKGATRMAKHRGSEKVELKDMSFFIDQSWDMVVPGFDAMPHKHIHAAPEREKDRKRARTVNPRAGRLGAGGGGGRGRDEE
ncbi:hypothetical protein CI109_104297 [Kwoniella shandongensis]|uniref:Transcription initiation factor TFIID subunit 12 domain-containing protein n=1 Tax=Kwoniella shandongensis TaxID=1734106 RepID=A0A5M6C0Y5_9TREE|nr:uncharacterized protein CI109_002798 [Kwoniella shandongensis]KAA5528644.1 hypothetical protein CI109_002798 [Kwoniella shandongensis]